MLPFWARMNPGVILMKALPAFPKVPALPTMFSISKTLIGREGLTSLQRCSQCILQPQPTGPSIESHFSELLAMSVLFYGWTIWTLTKCLEKKLHANYTRMLYPVLNKSWKQLPTKQQLYGHLPLISQTIPVRWVRYAEHYQRSKDELTSDILQ